VSNIGEDKSPTEAKSKKNTNKKWVKIIRLQN
jgi:hypothetical protein